MSISIVHWQLPLPPAVYLAVPTPTSQARLPNTFPPSGTPQADTPRSNVRVPAANPTGDRLPPYCLDMELPRYTLAPEAIVYPEPPTITMYLFAWGFLFPLFWVIGAFTLGYSLYGPIDRADSSTSHEKGSWGRSQHNFVFLRREAEMKWAKRCIWALTIIICIAISVGLSVWGVLRMKGGMRSNQSTS